MKKVYKIIDINIEKIWGSKKIENKNIGEVVKFEVNENQSNNIVDNQGTKYNLYKLYSSNQRKNFFGKKYLNEDVIPFMIKYIYSKKKLSLQVHPKEKKETWLFLKNNSKILIGLKNNLKTNQISTDYLLSNTNIVNCNKYDFAIVDPGTIHSILEDNCVCEIQNNYDVTYRYYDWNNNRELTQKEFVENARFKKFNMGKNIKRKFKKYKSQKFKITKLEIKQIKTLKTTNHFEILIVLEGKGNLIVNDEKLELNQNDTYFILPNAKCTILGSLKILVIY